MVIIYNLKLFKSFPLTKSKHFINNFASKPYTQFQEQKLIINNQTINYVKVGNGSHSILCLPGALGTIWTDFKPQVEGLSQSKFTIVAWDPPGYGFSRPPERNFNKQFYENDADFAKEFMHFTNMVIICNIKLLKSLLLSTKSNHFINNFARKKSSYRQIQEQKIIVNNRTINYIKVGNGSHTILCLPGVLGTIWSDFKPQVEGLSRSEFTIVAWDPPGYGFSRPPERSFNKQCYENDADIANKFMHKIGFSKFSLLGWSNGGISSLILAAKYPHSVEKLVIWGSSAYVTPEEIKVYENLKDTNKWSAKMRAPLIALYTEKGLQDMWTAWCNAVLEISEDGGDICKKYLSKIQCPTFILYGDKDPLIAREHPRYLLSNIKKSRIHRFPDGKHNIHLKYAKEFNQLVTEFLLK